MLNSSWMDGHFKSSNIWPIHTKNGNYKDNYKHFESMVVLKIVRCGHF